MALTIVTPRRYDLVMASKSRTDWLQLATETRITALQMRSPRERDTLLRIADAYEDMARYAMAGGSPEGVADHQTC
jgi:hypothetical protein